MELSDRVFLCQNKRCAYWQVDLDRDHNAALNILYEALRLIGLLDQAVDDIGSDDDVNGGCGRGVRPKMPLVFRHLRMKQQQRKLW